eukprot:scaffold84219_cov34-Tisochrysis_lutea.AAC.2
MARSLWRARLWKASSVPLVIAEQRLHQLAGTCLGVGAMKKSVLHLQLRCPSQLSRHIRSDRLWALLARCSTGHRSRGSPMHRPGSPPLTPLRLCRGTYRGPCEARCATWPPTSRAAACALVTARPRNYRPRGGPSQGDKDFQAVASEGLSRRRWKQRKAAFPRPFVFAECGDESLLSLGGSGESERSSESEAELRLIAAAMACSRNA